MTDYERITKTIPAKGKIHIVLDTDTKNEIDDQFALTYAFMLDKKEKLCLDAVYAAPFTHDPAPSAGEGMEQSYDEILKVLSLLGKTDTEGFVFRGSDRFMNGSPVDSPAARDLIARAMTFTPEEPLYVVAIGAITNVSSAIAMAPEIIDRIVVVWLGGTEVHQNFADEYNLMQDASASRLIFDCGVPLVQLPCMGVVDKFSTTVPELERYIDGKTEIGTYLTANVRDCAGKNAGSRVIWDVTAVGYTVHPEWFSSALIHSPRLTEEPSVSAELKNLDCYRNHRSALYWSHDTRRHLIRVVENINRDRLFADLFEYINAFGEQEENRNA